MPIEPIAYESVTWDRTRDRLNQFWVANESPHHSIIGLTGSGKSYLVRNGILPLAVWDKVLIIDVKGDDPTLRGLGKPVKRIPHQYLRTSKQLMQEKRPRDNWFRLVVTENIKEANRQVHEAFSRIYDEGEWVVVIDELRALVDTPAGMGIGHKGWWTQLMLRGRSKGISVINLTQEPAWVPSAFYTQPSFLWIGRVEDERAHKRISEVGTSRGLMPVLPTIPKRRFMYTDNLEDARVFHMTGL